MDKLTHDDLYSLEAYARERPAFRTRVLAHKRPRTVAAGPNVTFVFEDRLTIQYQIQEMLRVERVFEPTGIADELGAYNPLIPDGRNLKATMLIEFPDPDERARKLAELHGIEHQVMLHAGGETITAVADEDMERSNATKTSAVHFLRFELGPAAIDAFRRGTPVELALAHPHYATRIRLEAATLAALAADFD